MPTLARITTSVMTISISIIVKPRESPLRTALMFLPVRGVARTVQRHLVGTAAHVVDAAGGAGVIGVGFGGLGLPRVLRLGDGIDRQLADVACCDELSQIGRPLVLVGVELVH